VYIIIAVITITYFRIHNLKTALLLISEKMENFQFRAYIKTRALLGIKAIDIFNELQLAYPTHAPQYNCVAKWARLFIDGRQSLEDDPRPGRPITALTLQNISLVKQLIDQDPHSTYDEIEAHLSICQGTINRILHDCLKLRKVASRWIPHDLTDANREERFNACRENLAMFNESKWRLCDVVTGDESWIYWRKVGKKKSNATWIGEGQSPGTIVRRGRFESKSMITVFFRKTGVVHIDVMEKDKTIDASYYIENSLGPVIRTIEKQRPASGIKNVKLHHDNAKPHVAKIVKSYLEQVGMRTIRHPPYSPDLAPCDFWLFDYIKRHLDDHDSVKSLKRQITEILEGIPKEEYAKTFDKWLERMQLCIDNKGDYFEHLIKK
jgi:histone-lysine N-methyltransferase SETMAR